MQATMEHFYETDAGDANAGWNTRGALPWPNCVWRGVFAVAGYRQEGGIGEQSHRAQSRRGELRRFLRSGYTNGAAHKRAKRGRHDQIDELDQARERFAEDHQAN